MEDSWGGGKVEQNQCIASKICCTQNLDVKEIWTSRMQVHSIFGIISHDNFIPLKWTRNKTDQEQTNFERSKTSLIQFFMIKTLKKIIVLQAVIKNNVRH